MAPVAHFRMMNHRVREVSHKTERVDCIEIEGHQNRLIKYAAMSVYDQLEPEMDRVAMVSESQLFQECLRQSGGFI